MQKMREALMFPTPCNNLDNNHAPILDVYHAVDNLQEVKKSFIGSGVRYDLSMHQHPDSKVNAINRKYNEELIRHHVSGRLKVAPEHTAPEVLKVMRKPSFELFGEFKKIFDNVNSKYSLNQQLIPYFISSHPGCKEEDMAELAMITKTLDFKLEQVQDFTPTPMTVATEAYYTGVHPYTLKPIFTAKTKEEKQAQRKYFFWYLPENREEIVTSLRKMHRNDIIKALYPNYNPDYIVKRKANFGMAKREMNKKYKKKQ